jgi:hypothetical protein
MSRLTRIPEFLTPFSPRATDRELPQLACAPAAAGPAAWSWVMGSRRLGLPGDGCTRDERLKSWKGSSTRSARTTRRP